MCVRESLGLATRKSQPWCLEAESEPSLTVSLTSDQLKSSPSLWIFVASDKFMSHNNRNKPPNVQQCRVRNLKPYLTHTKTLSIMIILVVVMW